MMSQVSERRRSPVGWLIPAVIVVLAVVFFGPIGSFAVGAALVVWSLKLGRPERFVVLGVGAVLAVWPLFTLADDLLGHTVVHVS